MSADIHPRQRTSDDAARGADDGTEFLAHYNGRLTGVRSWEDLDRLVGRLLESPHDWFVYMVADGPPSQPVDSGEFARFVTELSALLRREHDHDYCGIVYVDDMTDPAMIKIYDPNDLGASCGTSGQPVLPGWVISKWLPVSLQRQTPAPRNRLRWWRALFGR